MTLTENFIHTAIHLEAGAEIMYDTDEMFDFYPCRFPTVELQLIATDALVEVADRIRMDKGYPPVHPRDGRTDDVDNDAWYDFYIGMSRLPHEGAAVQLDSHITFIVVNSDCADNEDMYLIDLTADERDMVLEVLNQQCRRYTGKTCAALMDEAEKEMMEDEDHEAERM